MVKHSRPTASFRSLLVCVFVLAAVSVFSAAQHEKVIHSFGAGGDGSGPLGGLIADASGNLYGTTEQGSGFGGCCGTVFELSPPVAPNKSWTETILYSFTDGADGGFPFAGLVLDSQGNLYGTTASGGNNLNCPTGCGTVFELSPPSVQGGVWSETTIYSFAGGNDGDEPYAGLILDQTGNLYGTTLVGGGTGYGGSGGGTVFELSPPSNIGGPWSEKVLYSFTGGTDGALPSAPVVFDSTGNLYGVTNGGGLNGCDFAGCGVVFELSPSREGTWIETVIYSFRTGDNLNQAPFEFGGLFITESGDLVCTEPLGGSRGYGSIYALHRLSDRKWAHIVLYSFNENTGDQPEGGVILVNGMLYGTALGGGPLLVGTVFQLTNNQGSSWRVTALYSLKSDTDGAFPNHGLVYSNGVFYGATTQGGKDGGGTVFSIGP